MATYDSSAVKKALRHRGKKSGVIESVSGVIRLKAGASIATTDLIRFLRLGENTRVSRVILNAVPVSGTPVLTNPTFAIGVVADGGTFTRADMTTYPAAATLATALVASMVLDADDMKQDIEVQRPVADSVPNYGPHYVTATPAGAGAFSVAGGDIDLILTVEFRGEVDEDDDRFVYTQYANTKVKGA